MPKITALNYLDDIAVEIYDATLSELSAPVSYTDKLLLGTYAQNYSDFIRLTEQIRSDGDMGADHNDQDRKHPLGIPQAKAFDMMTKAAASLGLERRQRIKSAGEKSKSKTLSLRKPARSMKAS